MWCVCVSGREWSDWSSELRIPGDELKWKFTSDGSVNGWGWRFTVYPIMPAAGELHQTHDDDVKLHSNKHFLCMGINKTHSNTYHLTEYVSEIIL